MIAPVSARESVPEKPAGSPKITSGDKRLACLISYTHHTSEYRQYCYVETQHNRVQPLAHGASSSVGKESQKNTEATWDHYLQILLSMVRKIYGKPLGDFMEDLNVNLAIWGMFMNTTLQAAVYL